MAPKKKGNKRQEEDWEADLGESAPGVEAPADEPANDDAADGEAPVGGLMATLRKNKEKKKAKKNKQANDFVEGEDAAPAVESKEPEEGGFDEDDVFAGKPKKPIKDIAPAPAAAQPEEGEFRVKSKKEKEREKKEREKQRKKEQAASKKKSPAQQKADEKKAAADAKKEADNAAAAAAAATPEPAAKGRKLPKHLAALQKQQEALRQQREEEERLAAEEKAALEAAQKAEEEEEKKRAEARALKKEKEREKKEQLRREGKLLTKAQREAQQKTEMRMKQMLASGVSVAGLQDGGAEKKRPVYENKKKKGGKRQEEDLEAAAERARAQREAEDARRQKEAEEKAKAEAAAAAPAEDDDAVDDWEKAAAEEDDVKDSWDAPSDEEETKEEAPANGAKPEAAAEKEESEEESEEDSDEDSSDEESSEDEEQTANQRAIAQRKAEAAERRKKQHEEALAARSKDNLRSPICCILGHVDTGKTKLLDKIRQTNVQEGEAGGITQQIGATYFPVEALKQKTAVVNKDGKFEFKVPGLLIIDTPGHESFSNLRSRGSSLCNIAILVVDIMHGLEPQTLESMRLLRDRKTPFIVALNKIDRLYGWKKIDNNGFQDSLAMQNKGVQNEFRTRLEATKLAFAEQGFNSELFYENKSMARNVSLVPTSAHTGEGVPDMLKLLTSLTQERMTNSLMYLSEVECTVLEVKVIEGLGTTIDVVLNNGILREGDRVVLCGTNGPITTNIRALLTPAPLKELRLKSHTPSLVLVYLFVGPDDDEEDLEDEVMSDLEALLSKVSTDNRGVTVQASTLGSLEALLEFLRVSKIPVANISIGPVYKRDVMMAGTMLEKAKEYAVMLCFDVKVDKEAAQYAQDVGVKIFTADIIYHLFDNFTAHMAELAQQRKEESKMLAVFPCVIRPVAVFNKKDPIVIGIDVIEGSLRLHTPLAAVRTNSSGVKEIVNIGRVTSIERDHKAIPICKKGQPSVAIKVEGSNQPMYGRHLEEKDTLYSAISRASIDTLKEFYRSDVTMEEWGLVKKLKPLFDIP
ncbi:Eukaryotic translation initiation factor 5B [Penicillium hetheringtonii]|uniref:Eukaryotic translation initiation factor 5B n=1 Tax=Penicillium hetheringtonii TaxID=911720 RepID=A0AAD6DFE8_9EURO|nr:Eukaryotic translation initiation factor 5B [Penicillium hetheringtonii]